jgi:hypothetical protein
MMSTKFSNFSTYKLQQYWIHHIKLKNTYYFCRWYSEHLLESHLIAVKVEIQKLSQDTHRYGKAMKVTCTIRIQNYTTEYSTIHKKIKQAEHMFFWSIQKKKQIASRRSILQLLNFNLHVIFISKLHHCLTYQFYFVKARTHGCIFKIFFPFEFDISFLFYIMNLSNPALNSNSLIRMFSLLGKQRKLA